HDPLCLRGLRAGEVAVMRRDLKGGVHVLTDLPSPEGLRVDQILTSEYFGLNSTRSPEDDQLFEEYYLLLAERKPSAAQRKRLAELKKLLADRDLFGDSTRERLMLEAADRYVAESRVEASGEKRAAMEEQVRQEIAALWDEATPRPKNHDPD
ncbi:MAG TPA: AAA family ATPase, partial [Thermoanaerobaculia bacterium]|nr:AAA family ATPase [Thermoanaerobaculia bacterium]